MMQQIIMDTQSTVALTVLGSLVISAAVLTVRTLLNQRVPARRTVPVKERTAR